MRSRKRLIEVMETVNPNVVGEIEAFNIGTAARCLRIPDNCSECAYDLTKIRNKTSSPHIRELVTQAIHYLHGEEEL